MCNGGTQAERAIRSALAQTFANFKIFISDNASTDSNSKDIRRFEKLDSRIHVHRHNTNIGVIQNFLFTLKQAQTEYFVWLAHDDWWGPRFLELNYIALRLNRDAVCSVSKAKMVNVRGEPLATDPGVNPLLGQAGTNLTDYLRAPACNSRFYGLFRTIPLQASFTGDDIYWAFDWVVMARTLSFGTHYRTDETQLFRTVTQSSTKSLSQRIKGFSVDRLGHIFPMLYMTRALVLDRRIPKSLRLLLICLYWNLRMCLVVNFLSPIRQWLAVLAQRLVDRIKWSAGGPQAVLRDRL